MNLLEDMFEFADNQVNATTSPDKFSPSSDLTPLTWRPQPANTPDFNSSKWKMGVLGGGGSIFKSSYRCL